MKKISYIPESCDSCHQSMTYILPVDLGTAEIVRAIASAIRRKGVNEVHPRREMETIPQKGLSSAQMIQEGLLSSNQVGNLSRPRFHGLIAAIEGRSGYYCLTRKGAQFLRGADIPRYAIISKVRGHQVGYWHEHEERITIRQLLKADAPRWEMIDFDIVNGQVVRIGQFQKQLQLA